MNSVGKLWIAVNIGLCLGYRIGINVTCKYLRDGGRSAKQKWVNGHSSRANVQANYFVVAILIVDNEILGILQHWQQFVLYPLDEKVAIRYGWTKVVQRDIDEGNTPVCVQQRFRQRNAEFLCNVRRQFLVRLLAGRFDLSPGHSECGELTRQFFKVRVDQLLE